MTDQTQTADAATRAVLVTALLVAAFHVVKLVFGVVVSFGNTLAYGSGGSFDYVANILEGSVWQFFTGIVPLAVGIFIGFRLVAPITALLALRSVLLRSVVAAGIAAAMALVIGIVFALSTHVTDNVFGYAFPLGEVGGAFTQAFASIGETLASLLASLPEIALAAVLLWQWLRRRS